MNSVFLPRFFTRGAAVTIVSALAVLVLMALFYRNYNVRYEALFGQMSPNETVRLIERLEAAGADYRIEPGGLITVPAEDVPALRQKFEGFGVTLPENRSAVETAKRGERSPSGPLWYGLLVLSGVLIVFGVTAMRQKRVKKRELRFTLHQERPQTPQKKVSEVQARVAAETVHAELPGDDIHRRAASLAEEHPQTAAVYLLSQSSETAAHLLDALPQPFREAVWIRMTAAEPCDDALVRQIRDALASKTALLRRRELLQAKTIDVFEHLTPDVRRGLLHAFERNSPERYRQMLPQLIQIEDLLFLNAREWAQVSRGFAVAELKAAFRPVEEALTEPFFATMTSIKSDVKPPAHIQAEVVRHTLLARARKLAGEGRFLQTSREVNQHEQ